jgi:hypothetical protein
VRQAENAADIAKPGEKNKKNTVQTRALKNG